MVRSLRLATLTAFALAVGLGTIGCEKPASNKGSPPPPKMSSEQLKDKMSGGEKDKDKMTDKDKDKMTDKDKDKDKPADKDKK